ncbi:MAG TPA: hypothetical protein VMH27_16625 [Puia sp.]|nr:hypothetical protein [Puia sp.]
MQKNIICLLFLWCAVTTSIIAQSYNTTIGQVSIVSPTAASLGKYGDIPVNEHTGIPEVNIPIYTINTRSIQLPISLNYHASGLKVQEQASWVGAGWSLDAGGVITRTVVGAPDDRGLNSAFTTKGHYSDYGYSSYLFSPGPAGCNSTVLPYCPVGRTGMPVTNNPAQDGNIEAGIFDGEPDLYFFNFNGHTGKFYFNDDRTPIIMPEQDMQIAPIYSSTDWRGMIGFVITTPDGLQYYFGQNPNTDGNPDAIEITYDVTTQLQYNGQGAVSAWYLNKIYSPDRQDSISLIYKTESYSYYLYSMFPIPSVENPNLNQYTHEYDLCKNFTNGVRLSKIVFSDGEVDFTPGALRQDMSLGTGPFPNYTYTGLTDQANNDAVNGARSLGSITIKSSSLCKKDSLYYGYFYDNTPLTGQLLTVSYPQFQPTSDEYRLRLDSVRETSCDASLHVPSYKFAYYSGTVPRKLSMGIDHWGFYNGVTSNQGLIPTYTVAPQAGLPGQLITYPGADRDTHWPYSEGGALQQITYPTGGYTQFTYESNYVYTATPTYTKTVVSNLTAGYGNQTVTGTPFTTNADTYEIDMSSNQPNTETGGTLNLLVNGFVSQNYSVGAGLSNTTYTTLPSGTTYTPQLVDNNNNGPLGGSGISETLYDLVPSTVYGNSQVGGVRIKTITHNDGMTATNQVTNYQYTFNNVTGGQSSGILFSQPVYVQAIRNDLWAEVNGLWCSSLGCMFCYTGASYYQSPSSIRPMATSMGNHIGYAEVYVSQTGNGYTEYQYYGNNGAFVHPSDPPITDVCVRTTTTYCSPAIPNSPAAPLPFDPQRGELAYRAEFNASGQLLKSMNSIPLYQFDSLTTPGLIDKFFVTNYEQQPVSLSQGQEEDPLANIPSLTFIPVGVAVLTEYNLQSAKKVRDSVVTRLYDPLTGNSTTDIGTTYYGSRYHHQPTQTLAYSSSGQTLVSKISHAFDFRISNFNIPDQLPTFYSNINLDNTWLSDSLGNIKLAISDPNYILTRWSAFQDWRYMEAIDRQTYITWRKQTYGPGGTYATDHTSAEAAADGELKPVLVMQDNYQDPVIETSTWNSGRLIHSEYTHHDFSSNPAGSVYPYNTQLINLQAPSTTFAPAAVSGNSIVKDSRYALESSDAWALGNVQQVTPHSGVTNAYIWDYNNSEPIAKAVNTTIDQIAYTSFESNGTGGWTFSASGVDPGHGFTGNGAYSLAGGGAVSRTGLTGGNTYVVSYWSMLSTASTVTGTISVLQGKTININGTTWYYFEHTITGVTSVSVSGTAEIDELRLYPSTAQMTTYTYNLLEGISSECDVDNRVTYYYYDMLGRLKYIKDQDGNIIKTIEYHYMNQ